MAKVGKIRGLHSSPGIYIKYTGVPYKKEETRQEVTTPQTLKSTSSSGGGGISPKPVFWVFGDTFPVIFS